MQLHSSPGMGNFISIQPPQERTQAQVIQKEKEEYDDSQWAIKVSTNYRGRNLCQAREKRK
ncbi:hypothetical protein N7463_002686 [Penicillium fimorum]|uniref:Uncharacterized protein n=1 Tax=Penicillium fimorum TaxID=1882269 RepID=A0A9W9Y181_9EURO|nr:hypothetical protein N7463_002686 [Penicillium fimorum]